MIGLTGVSQVMQGYEGLGGVASAAIRWDGRLWTWGCNGTGWLATGTTADAVTPTLVATFTNVSQFAIGDDLGLHDLGFSLAVGTLADTVPSLIGDTLAQASAVLADAGLTLGTVSYVADYTCTNLGLVRSQSPSAGDRHPVRLGGLGHDREGPAAALSVSLISRCTSARALIRISSPRLANSQSRRPVLMEGSRYPAFPVG